MFQTSLRRFGLLGALFIATMPGPGFAETTAPETKGVGAWDLKLDNGSRQCRIMLRGDILDAGYAVGMPVGCHRAFPMLASVAIWNETGDGQIQLDDSAGQPVVNFETGAHGMLIGTGPQGDIYRLEPVGPHFAVKLKLAAQSAERPASPSPAVAKALAAHPPVPKTEEIAGHYAVLRDKGHDTGCMVTLDEKAHGPKGTLKANLAPACRDQGIVIFDPVGWEMIGGRMVLMARKGHTTKLDIQEDGTWLKDPKDGKSMGLKRL